MVTAIKFFLGVDEEEDESDSEVNTGEIFGAIYMQMIYLQIACSSFID